MNTITSRIIYCGLALALTLISGVMLSNSGKPLNSSIFALHKLSTVATVILLGVNIHNLYIAGGIHTLHLVAFASTGLLFLTLIVSGAMLSLAFGALLSLDKPALQAILRVHQISPLLVLIAATISMYLSASSGSWSRMGVVK